jgi:hypothetical protein
MYSDGIAARGEQRPVRAALILVILELHPDYDVPILDRAFDFSGMAGDEPCDQRPLEASRPAAKPGGEPLRNKSLTARDQGCVGREWQLSKVC